MSEPYQEVFHHNMIRLNRLPKWQSGKVTKLGLGEDAIFDTVS